MDINSNLEQIGLSTKEAKAYTALLKHGQANPHQISNEAKIERTTIYKILNDLVDKGLATKSMQGARITFAAEPPVRLKQYLEQQVGIADQMLPILLALQGKKQEKPIIKLYENAEGIKQALLESLNCEEKIRRDFASVESIVEFLGQRFIDHQIEERVKRGIKVHSLRSLPTKESIQNKDWYLKGNNEDLLREVRYLPEPHAFQPVIFIYDNTVTIISSKKESYALVIESKELSRAMKILFDIAWVNAKLSE